ncbi:MAG TPA: tRNA pseudouridine(13) synthase TruD [Planctomycetota bacterium]|nr:tRNA pseudouridine(13) synthase TruD [Planctomycetota bacterium]
MESNTLQNVAPTILPHLCPPWPGAHGILYKESPEDFVVEELPLYEPSGTGTHTWMWIEKRGLTTHAAARTLAQKLGKNPADAGIAGLKDAHAITRQWISFEHVTQSADELRAISDEKLRVLNVTRHGNKLRMGHLRGNRFSIHLKLAGEMPGPQALFERVQFGFDELKRRGIPNYFGEQRFGNTGANPALGKMLVLGDDKAFHAAMAAAGQARQAQDRRIRNLLVNAFQSELFNRVLAARLPAFSALKVGDLAWLHRNGAVFKIYSEEEARREQSRADAHEISPSGPVFGPKMAQPEGLPSELETRILHEAGVTLADFGRKEAERQPGARRPLRIFFLEEPHAEIEHDGVLLRFALPSGSYATVVLDEICARFMQPEA